MRFQFQIDGRPAGPVRAYWVEAAQDAVNAGYAVWGGGSDHVHIDSNQGAAIARISSR